MTALSHNPMRDVIMPGMSCASLMRQLVEMNKASDEMAEAAEKLADGNEKDKLEAARLEIDRKIDRIMDIIVSTRPHNFEDVAALLLALVFYIEGNFIPKESKIALTATRRALMLLLKELKLTDDDFPISVYAWSDYDREKAEWQELEAAA